MDRGWRWECEEKKDKKMRQEEQERQDIKLRTDKIKGIMEDKT